MTVPQAALIDTGNPLLARVPVDLKTGAVETPAGKLGVLTLRTSSSTLTLFLSAGDLRDWTRLLTELANQLTGGIVPATAADVAVLHSAAGHSRR